MRKTIVLLSLILTISFAGHAQNGGGKMTAQEVIRQLDLKPLPEEGGYYRETYRGSSQTAPARIFGINSDSDRTISTAILYLVVPESFSALHRVKSDEIFHFYGGDPVEMIQIDEAGKLTRFTIGNDFINGQSPQVLVPKQVWQALRLKPGGSWALMGTTVAPGFEFEDFEIGPRDEMLRLFPQHEEEVIRFTRGEGEEVH